MGRELLGLQGILRSFLNGQPFRQLFGGIALGCNERGVSSSWRVCVKVGHLLVLLGLAGSWSGCWYRFGCHELDSFPVVMGMAARVL